MTSFISPSEGPRQRRWRNLAWLFWVIVSVAIIESAMAFLVPSPESARLNFFEYKPGRPETPDRIITAEKLRLFAQDNPAILQVGDSSGFHGIQPPVMEAKLGLRYLNMNVFGSQGYEGYYQVAKYMFERNRGIRYLVLYTTVVGQQPRLRTVEAGDLLGDDIKRDFNSPLHRLFHLPSLALRPEVTDFAFFGATGGKEQKRLRVATRYFESALLIPQAGGWTREEDNYKEACAPIPGFSNCADVVEPTIRSIRHAFGDRFKTDAEYLEALSPEIAVTSQVFDWSRLRYVDIAEQVYDRFLDLAQKNGAEFVIVGAPLSDIFNQEKIGENIRNFVRFLHDYAGSRQGVHVVDPVFWPDDRFSSTVHVATPSTHESSLRLAAALSDIIHKPGADAARAPRAAPPGHRMTMREVAMTVDHPPVYGFGPAVEIDGQVYRGIREGRYEGLVFIHAPSDVTRVRAEFAPGIDDTLLDKVSLTVFGEQARCLSRTQNSLTWELPSRAMRYGGFMELLVSTRGATTWQGHELVRGATGPEFKISRLVFE